MPSAHGCCAVMVVVVVSRWHFSRPLLLVQQNCTHKTARLVHALVVLSTENVVCYESAKHTDTVGGSTGSITVGSGGANVKTDKPATQT